jgi:UDP-3-O-[3-hydroxymyristoyl] glucosamine N-acyltransferase
MKTLATGYQLIEGSRWTNPDGFEGGWASNEAKIHSSVKICHNAVVGRCEIAEQALIGEYAQISSDVTLEKGVVICSGAEVGVHVVVKEYTRIEEHTVLCDNAYIGANCTVYGNSIVGNNGTLEAFSIVRENVRLGNGASVGFHCLINDYCTIDGIVDNRCLINRNTRIAVGAVISDNSQIGANCEIGEGVLLPEGTILADGVILAKDDKWETLISPEGPITAVYSSKANSWVFSGFGRYNHTGEEFLKKNKDFLTTQTETWVQSFLSA